MNAVIGGNYKGALISLTFSQKKDKRLKMTYQRRSALLIPSVTEFVDKGRTKKGHLIEIRYNNGKVSLAEVNDNIYAVMLASSYDKIGTPDKPPAHSKSVIWPYVALGIVLMPIALILCAASGAWEPSQSAQDSDEPVETAAKPLKYARINDDGTHERDAYFYYHLDGGEAGEYGYGQVRGRILNSWGKDATYVQVTIGIYDGDGGAKLTTCLDNVAGLGDRETWSFEAHCSGVLGGFQYKIDDITYF